MKPDPYLLIRSILARRIDGTVVKPMPPILRPKIVLAKPRRTRILST